MRKIMLAVPLKGQVSSFFVKNIMEALMTKMKDINFVFTFLEGPAIQMARNEIVAYARQQKCDELVQIDKDLDAAFPALMRLLFHEKAPVVCGLYCKRHLDTFWHVQPWDDNTKEDENGLLRVRQSAIGFSKIRMEVFDKLELANPDRIGSLNEGGKEPVMMTEFFPMELMGKNTPKGRLDLILKYLDDDKLLSQSPGEIREQIRMLSKLRFPEPNHFMGEDYGFCRLCADAGIPIYLDTHLMVKHDSSVMVPVDTEQLIKMLKEKWREDELPKGLVLP